jgi:hypothetical protein
MRRRKGEWLLVLTTTACGGRESVDGRSSNGVFDAAASVTDAPSTATADDGGGVPDRSEGGDASVVAPNVLAVCDHYFAANQLVLPPLTRWAELGGRSGCNGIVLPESETARLRARFEQVCLNEMALPGSGITPASLEACAAAIDASPCNAPPVECMFFGTRPGGAPCNENFQCQSGSCDGTFVLRPIEQGAEYGPTICGTCEAPLAVGQICNSPAINGSCPANTTCTGSPAPATCTPLVQGDVGASCDGFDFYQCKTGLYCDPQTGQCAYPRVSGASCDYNVPPNGPPSESYIGVCAAPLSCVGDPDAATCTTEGSMGGFCQGDSDCAPGLGCILEPCAERGMLSNGCTASGTCGSVTWVSAGQPCDYTSTRCLVGSCIGTEDWAFPAPLDGGPFPGTCPQVVADGQSADTGSTYSTCDTFAQPFSPTAPDGGSGTCLLLDSVVCK